jgi:hypothetical protein
MKYWIENEYTIFGKDWRPVKTIEGKSPSSKIIEVFDGNLRDKLDTELSTCQLEIKSWVHNSIEDAIKEVKGIYDHLCNSSFFTDNDISLVSLPVVKRAELDMKWFKPHHKKMIDSLRKTNYSDDDIAKAVSAASTQVNISWIFDWMSELEMLKFSVIIFNKLREIEDQLYSKNWEIKCELWKTRKDYYGIIPIAYKWELFKKNWYSKDNIIIQPEFKDITEMVRYFSLHSRKTDFNWQNPISYYFRNIEDKVLHMFLWKLKKEQFSWIELRWFDATDNLDYIWTQTEYFISILSKLKQNFLEWYEL